VLETGSMATVFLGYHCRRRLDAGVQCQEPRLGDSRGSDASFISTIGMAVRRPSSANKIGCFRLLLLQDRLDHFEAVLLCRCIPRLLRTTPAKKPRTECCCQWVARMMAAIVAPSGRSSIASTRACFEPARLSGSASVSVFALPERCCLRVAFCAAREICLRQVIASGPDRVTLPVHRPPFSRGAANASSAVSMAARPAPVIQRAIAPLSSSRRQTGSEPLALTSSSKPPRISLSTTFPAAFALNIRRQFNTAIFAPRSRGQNDALGIGESCHRDAPFVGAAPSLPPPKPHLGHEAGGAGSRDGRPERS
jgi:hypothetical protein